MTKSYNSLKIEFRQQLTYFHLSTDLVQGTVEDVLLPMKKEVVVVTDHVLVTIKDDQTVTHEVAVQVNHHVNIPQFAEIAVKVVNESTA